MEAAVKSEWPSIEANVDLTHAVTWRDQRRQRHINEITESAARRKIAWLRVSRSIEQLDPTLAEPSKRLFAELVSGASLYDRMEMLDDPIQYALDQYELANARLTEASHARKELVHSIIGYVVIIVLLVAQLLLMMGLGGIRSISPPHGSRAIALDALLARKARARTCLEGARIARNVIQAARSYAMRAAILGLAGLLSVTSLSFGAVLTTDADIRHAIIGNTISGVEDGKSYAEFYQPDGYIHGARGGRALCGRVAHSRPELLCAILHKGEGPDREEVGSGDIGAWECMGVDIKGSSFAWVKDGERYKAQIVRGNPNKL